MTRTFPWLLCSGVLSLLAAPALGHAQTVPEGAVYAMTNAADGNEVVVWNRGADGGLTRAGAFATEGRGSGGRLDPLGSQGSLRLSNDLSWLYAVNAGSDSVSVFRVLPDGLELAGETGSGGSYPVSLARRGDRLYVLNAGGDASVATFTIGPAGDLTPLPGALRSLGAGGRVPPNTSRAPSQVGVSLDGRWLVALDKGRNLFLAFALDAAGRPASVPVRTRSVGRLPFSFAFGPGGVLVVAEIFGRSSSQDAAGASAASSYRLGTDGRLRALTVSLPTGQTALCWIKTAGGFAWGTNTANNTVTAFRLAAGGTLRLAQRNGVTYAYGKTPRLPLDLAVTPDGLFLYTLNEGTGTIGMFRVRDGGRLTSLGEAAGLPVFRGAQGIAAR